MARAIVINRPDVVSMIQEAAAKLTGGDTTAVVGIALSRLLDQEARSQSLFGAHPGSVSVHDGVDLLGPVLDVEPEAVAAAQATHGQGGPGRAVDVRRTDHRSPA